MVALCLPCTAAVADQLECTDPARNDFLEPAGDSTDLHVVHCKGSS